MAYIDKFLEPGESITYRARHGILAYIGALLMFFIVPTGLIRLASSELALTNKRVLARRGMLWHRFTDLPYAEVAAVRVKQGVLDRIYDYGAVAIVGKDGTTASFASILHPKRFKEQFDAAQEMAVLGRRLEL